MHSLILDGFQDAPMSTKQSEKYLLWHRAIIRYLDVNNCTCEVQLENNIFSTQGIVNYTVEFENLFPLIGNFIYCIKIKIKYGVFW